MLTKEKAVGNYLIDDECLKSLRMNSHDRETMIAFLQEIHRIKGYSIDTFFLACSIIDRFLQELTERREEAPHLALLATVSLMIAAKLSEPVKPCFEYTIRILPPSLRKKITEKRMIKLELKIIEVLDFDLLADGPLPFLDRYAYLLSTEEDIEFGRADALLTSA